MTNAQETLRTDPLSQIGDAIESATGSLSEAASNASESAKVAARKAKNSARTGVYNAAYGLSYGLVFGAVFLVELLPEESLVRRGFEDGAGDGFDAAIAKSAARRSRKRIPYGADDEEVSLDETSQGSETKPEGHGQ